MAKVYPQTPTASSNYMTKTRETFTVWMKSLLFHGNGCTVFDSNGDIVYRIDNYNQKCSGKVYLMDLRGKVLFLIQQKRLQIFRSWVGYKCCSLKEEKPRFRVREEGNILRGNIRSCHVSLGFDKATGSCYKIVGLTGKSAFKIIDSEGALIAEVTQKTSCSGVLLGDDVLNLVVEAQVDHSLVMALVTVYGLINHKL